MKAKFEFDLTSFEGRADFETYCQAQKLKSAMWEFSQQVLRKYRKYSIDEELKDVLKKSMERLSEASYTVKADKDGNLDITEMYELMAADVVEFIEDKFYEILNEHEAKVTD